MLRESNPPLQLGRLGPRRSAKHGGEGPPVLPRRPERHPLKEVVAIGAIEAPAAHAAVLEEPTRAAGAEVVAAQLLEQDFSSRGRSAGRASRWSRKGSPCAAYWRSRKQVSSSMRWYAIRPPECWWMGMHRSVSGAKTVRDTVLSAGIEPAACALRGRRSATELRQRMVPTGGIEPPPRTYETRAPPASSVGLMDDGVGKRTRTSIILVRSEGLVRLSYPDMDCVRLDPVPGIEPGSARWRRAVLPLDDTGRSTIGRTRTSVNGFGIRRPGR